MRENTFIKIFVSMTLVALFFTNLHLISSRKTAGETKIPTDSATGVTMLWEIGGINTFVIPLPDGEELSLGREDFIKMTEKELQNFIVFLNMLRNTNIGGDLEAIQIIGIKLLPKFFHNKSF